MWSATKSLFVTFKSKTIILNVHSTIVVNKSTKDDPDAIVSSHEWRQDREIELEWENSGSVHAECCDNSRKY